MNWTKNIQVTNEDNMQLMARYPDGYFDIGIIDLEYGLGASKPSKKPNQVKQSNGNKLGVKNPEYKPQDWDFQKSSPEYFEELFRVTKRQIIFGGNYYGLQGGYLIWDKLNGDNDQFGCEMAWLSFSKRTDVVYYLWSGMMQGVYCGKDIKRALKQQGNKKKNEKRIQVGQKPVILYKYILENYVQQGERILDTHAGSCSLAIACHDLDFELVACEKNSDNYNGAFDRFKKATAQLKLKI